MFDHFERVAYSLSLWKKLGVAGKFRCYRNLPASTKTASGSG